MVTVSENALREFIRDAINNDIKVDDGCEQPVNVNDVVDPSAVVTDPSNLNFKPTNSVELQVAVKALSDDLPTDQVSTLYDELVTAFNNTKSKNDRNSKMKTDDKDVKTESKIRAAVRKHIKEAFPRREKNFGPVVGPLPPVQKIPAGVHGGEYMRKIEKSKKDMKAILKSDIVDDFGGAEEVEVDSPTDRKVNNTVSDVEGTSFQDIATELGFSVAGAKQAVDKALAKAQWVSQMQMQAPEDLELIVLTSMNDYIKMLSKTGELSSADVKLMKDHPDIVRDLDGFREFLDRALRRARKQSDPMTEAGTVSGTCPKCKKKVKLNADGLVDFHKVPGDKFNDCPGARNRPVKTPSNEGSTKTFKRGGLTIILEKSTKK